MKRTVLVVVTWIVIVTLFMLVGWNRISLVQDTFFSGYAPTAPSWNPLDAVVRGDAFWYLDIAKNGYSPLPDAQGRSNVVFFPLYPALIWVFHFFLFGNAAWAGWLVSLVSLIGACLVLHRLITEFHPEIEADAAIWSLLCFPTAVFLCGLYTESLFLFLSVATVYFVRKRRYPVAGLLGGLAALTRLTGCLLFILAVVEFCSHEDWRKRLGEGAYLLLIPAGLLAFFAYHAFAFHDPFLFFKAEAGFGRLFFFSPDYWNPTAGFLKVILGLDIVFFILGLASTMIAFKKLRPSYGWYMLASLGIAFTSGSLMAVNRYDLVLFPIPMLIATLKPALRQYVWFASTLLLAMYAILFVQGSWVG
jgi:Gpi18-like mannosyltransferase